MSMDQRSFFRLDVTLPCSYRVISAEEAQAHPLPSSPDTSYIEKYFLENLGQLDEQINDIINQIGSKSLLMATALTAINSKINFILQTVDQKQLTKAIPQRMVNLSASGLAFDVEETVTINDKIDLLIQPLKDESPILVRCNIVKVMPGKSCANCSMVALEYAKLSEDDRRKLVYFIQSKEIEMARLSREK
ncbi:PilZ domain-containing protein [Thiosulfativibrio zosterae]|uniref:PilZ domain-containing protein n=1 Tax=Thiosulfativibrio zosterae TaxID=2675053 RepID=A0A6F8PLW0_9GAMM|nr:PilZ domain-containing protein [Thiosulfativibrio zosterae]BBP43058.1 hypothetical protein THMIRHAT_08040 [Thiosulfativibrio zosterae]